jgi:hypothetical protein
MKKVTLLLLGCLFLTTIVQAQEISSYSVYFETDRSNLQETAQQTLDELAAALVPLHLNDYQVEVEAHTDSRGTDTYNDQLAERRAQSVKEYLSAKGILIEHTIVRAFGEQHPSFSNEDEVGRQKNRRVDIIVTYTVPKSLDDLFAQWSEEQMQSFLLDPTQGNKILGAEGTSIWIDANSFEYADGTGLPKGKVQFNLREAYQTDAIIMANLTTSSKDELLETGGMVFTEAFDESGKELKLRTESTMRVSMPTSEMEEGMELFMGEQGENGQLNDWRPTRQSALANLDAYLALPPKPRAPVLLQKPVYVRYEGEDKQKVAAPKAPAKPYKPGKPHQPTADNSRYEAGFFEALFMSKKKRQQKDAAVLAEKTTVYEKEMQTYRERMLKYDAAYAKYEEEYQTYQEALAEWKKLEMESSKVLVYQDVLTRQENEQLRADFESKKAAFKQRMDAWKEFRNEKLLEFEQKYAAQGDVKMNESFLNAYIFNVNELGWINCDRFYGIPEAMKEPLVIADEDYSNEKIFVICKDIRSMLRAERTTKAYRTRSMPKGMDVRVVAIKLDNGQPYISMVNTKVGQEDQVALSYKACSLPELRKSLNELN